MAASSASDGPAGEIGVMAAMLGVGGIAGALLAPYLHRMVSPHASLLAPDRLRGRLTEGMGMIGDVSAAAGPAFGGLLVQAVSGTFAVLLIATAIAVIAVVVTSSPTMRSFPRDEVVAGDTSEQETTKGR